MRNPFLKNTFKFMGMFVLITIISLILLFGTVAFIGTGAPLNKYVPIRNNVDVDKLDWELIDELSGVGLVMDSEGNIIQSFNDYDGPKKLSVDDVADLMRLRDTDKTTAIYDTVDGNKLLLMYPSNILKPTLSLDVNEVMGEEDYKFLLLLIGILAIYLVLVYLIIRRLSRNIQREIDKLRDEEEAKKDLFFRGLAHDVKTPLSGILAYSTAIKDGMVPEESVGDYLDGVHRNALTLKERVDEMMNLTTLNEQGIYNPEEGDLLEAIRRYIGQNYSWYLEKDAIIDIGFEDDEKFVVNFDKKLFDRVLQNLLENSVKHNEPGVKITVDFDKKHKTLTIKDSGKGVPEEIRDKIFEPMMTADKSRTGEHLRGMGLANVKRIIKLHGWEIEYDKGFKIEIK